MKCLKVQVESFYLLQYSLCWKALSTHGSTVTSRYRLTHPNWSFLPADTIHVVSIYTVQENIKMNIFSPEVIIFLFSSYVSMLHCHCGVVRTVSTKLELMKQTVVVSYCTCMLVMTKTCFAFFFKIWIIYFSTLKVEAIEHDF